MPATIIKSFAKKTGKSEKEIEQLWKKANKEASSMGKSKDYDYIVGILKNMLGLDEEINIKDFTNMFIESEDNFDKFYETLTAGNIESGDIPDTLKYVKRPQESEEDEDEEGKEYEIAQASPEMKKKLGVKEVN